MNLRSLAVGILLGPGIVGAQAPLEIPTQIPRRCHVQATAADGSNVRGAVHFRFDFGAVPGNEGPRINVSFDSTGKPLSLVELQTVSVPHKDVTVSAASATFRSTGVDGMIIRHQTEWREPTKPRAEVKKVIRPLTDAEKAKAQTLAKWLWENRCAPRLGDGGDGH